MDVLFTMPSVHALMDTLRDLLVALAQLAIAWIIPILFALLVYISWRMLRMMPSTKPVEITPRSDSAVRWDDVAGVDEVRAELQEVVEFLRHPGRFEKLGARVPSGVLLYGPPGTGKTLLAKAVAHESGATFFSRSASSFVEMFAGVGAAASASSSPPRASTRPPSSSSTSSTPSAGRAAAGLSTSEQTRRSTSSSSSWTASTRRHGVIVHRRVRTASTSRSGAPAARPLRPAVLVSVARPLRPRADPRRPHARQALDPSVDLDVVARRTAGLGGADLANLVQRGRHPRRPRRPRDAIGAWTSTGRWSAILAGLQQPLITDKEKRSSPTTRPATRWSRT